MADSYVCSKAKIQCSCGDRISTLTVYPDRTIWLTGQPQANISDHISMKNIAPFGRCHTTAFPPTGSATAANHGTLTPMPCIPNTPFPWMGGKDDVFLKGQPALLKSSKCKCLWGGTITITFDGQTQGDTTLVHTVSKFKTEYKHGKTIITDSMGFLKHFDQYSENERNQIILGANALPDNIDIDDRLKLAEHSILLAKSLEIGIDHPMSIEQADRQSANPNYKVGNDYSVNCATVVQAYALRLRGLNVTANPRNNEHELNDWIAYGHVFDVWKNIDGSNAQPSTYVDWMKRKGIKNMTPELYKEFIEENTEEEGVYIINVGWIGGGGHATIIQKWQDNNGELHLSYIEPQVYSTHVGVKQSLDNLVANMSPSPLDNRGIMRVDNKMFAPEYLSLFEIPNGNSVNNNKTST